MAGTSKNPGWRTGDGKGPPPKPGVRHRWQPGDDAGPRHSGRWAKLLVVLVGLGGVAAGFWYLINLLIAPNPPRLVVVGADPAGDVLRLDVPPDFGGWATGRQLVSWGKAEEKASSLTAKVIADGDRPDALPSDPAALDDWVGKLAGGKAADGRVLIYLGLHGGVDVGGNPVLWVGKGDRLKAADLFGKLADKLPGRDVVVLLDPGRLGPDPNVGRLADTFADRLKKDEGVKAALEKHPKLVALVGADVGEAGWESDELQLTAFGQAVLRGLRGEGPSATAAITARELFEFIKTATADWSAGNRPARQTPFLLPAGEAGLTRAAGMVAAYKSAAPSPVPGPDTPVSPNTLKKLWQRHDELDRRAVPAASYAPLAWRRGRELLLRYQQAVRAGDRGAAAVLEPAVTAEFDRVAGSVPAVVDKSRVNSVPLAEMLGDPAADADRELTKVSAAESLKNVEFDRLRGPNDSRPVESLLACLVDDFYRKQAAGAPPGGWVTAIGVRRAAERAAFGGMFSERSWLAVRPEVEKADFNRRQAEDRLFATPAEQQAMATNLLKDAAAGYATATTRGAAIRDGSKLRDQLFADLPFLGRWAVTGGNPDAVKAAGTAWHAAHKLVDALDTGEGLAGAMVTAQANGDALRELFAKAVVRLNSPPESQDAWEAHEKLLASPLVPADLRLKAIELVRNKAREWLAGTTRSAATDAGSRAARDKEATRWHARLLVDAAGAKLLDTQHTAETSLSNAARLELRLGELADAKEDWADKATALGHELSAHLRRMEATVFSKEYADLGRVADAERFSRVTVLLTENRAAEPAAVAAAVRWQSLLVGLADRTFRDHWHDEAQEPYWQRAANRYLADARRAVPPELPRVLNVEAVLADYPDARRLSVKPAAGTPDPIPWTSQRRWPLGFQAAVPVDFPPEVTGFAVGWRAVPDGPLRWDGPTERVPLTVAPNNGGTLAGILALKDTVAEDAQATVAPSARLYFRGQRPDGRLTVKLNRKPERVIVEPLPPRQEAVVAVRADPLVPLGQVAVLIDYSGSMKQDAADGRLYDGWEKRDTKFKRVQAALRQVLAALPPKTPLRVRIFSAVRNGKEVNARVFPETGGPPEVTWGTAEDKRYQGLLDRLAGFTPDGYTPLVREITEAVNSDFDHAGPRAGLPKTLVVLTDGVDETKQDAGPTRVQKIARRIAGPDGLTEQLRKLFAGDRGRGVGLYVVPFGQNAEDEGLCRELFKGVGEFDTPGRLLKPAANADTDALVEQLLAAVFPKLKLLGGGGAQPPGLDATGLPSRPDRSRRPPLSLGNGGTDIRWSPPVPAGTYTAQPNPGRTGPRLTLAESDAVVLGFAPDGAGGVRVRRELLSDYYQQTPTDTGRTPAGKWAVTRPWPVLDRQTLDAVVYVERVPPHRLTPADDRPADLSADPPDPRGDGHEVVWFDVLGAGTAAPPPGRITITRVYGHPAPAYLVERADWTGDPRSRLRVVVAGRDDGLPEPRRLTLGLPRQDQETVLSVTDDDVVVRTAVEDRPPDGPPEPGVNWLLVRVSHRAGRPVFARLADERLKRAANRHRYYAADAGRAEYTAAFALPTAEVARLTEVRVTLADGGWALSDANRERLAATLEAAPPKGDRQGAPRAVEPAAAGDR